MSDNKRITIEIDTPEVDINNKKELRECAKTIADDLADQIIQHLISHEQQAYIEKWSGIIKRWDTERIILEKKHARMRAEKARQEEWQKLRASHQAKVDQQTKETGKR